MGRESFEDDPRSGRPATATIDCVHPIVMDDERLTINQIANAISICRKNFENILHKELGLTKISVQWVSCLLTSDQKWTRLIISRENLALFGRGSAGFLEHFPKPG
ncbi:uncharacterized protein LOC115214391 [Octopus sinensis]|uniref:Uncharacterized protein LOC115214391 n=1 Tax=Octopus sinensis TaxID=2607531 RepID=A0A6P7SLZ7_9MOLL|nr:uncharacterized protein LOC115214391 [Octopus sinensis]